VRSLCIDGLDCTEIQHSARWRLGKWRRGTDRIGSTSISLPHCNRTNAQPRSPSQGVDLQGPNDLEKLLVSILRERKESATSLADHRMLQGPRRWLRVELCGVERIAPARQPVQPKSTDLSQPRDQGDDAQATPLRIFVDTRPDSSSDLSLSFHEIGLDNDSIRDDQHELFARCNEFTILERLMARNKTISKMPRKHLFD
jgi:hypothetical protein